MAGVKRALSEMFPNEEVEEEEDGGEPDVKKNLMDAFVQDTPVKGVGSLEARPEHMKVYLRVRPLTKAELAANENQNCLEIENELTVSTHAPKDSHYYKASTHGLGKTTHKFTFSKIFGESTSQKAFFDETMLGMVKDFVDGQNCLVFSYGVTNAGKTYTIQGNPKDAGLLPRALDVLFNSIEGKQWERMDIKPRMFVDVVKLSPEQEALEAKVKDSVMKMSLDEDPNVMSLLGEDASSDASRINNTTASSESSIAGHTSKESESLSELMEIENRVREETAVAVEVQGMVRFSVWISFAEVYNEHIFDLLEEVPRKKTERRKVLKVSEDRKGSPYVKGLKYINVRSADEAYKLMTIGQRNLRKACTKLNHNSSRSHCIFNIKVLQVVNTANPHVARVSMLTLCDLAGSERCTKTLATGERLKEAGNINTSLHTLGRCLENLRYNQSHKDCPKMIPFREGKLTRLFQNFFCGKGKAAMIVNVNQCASMFDETFHVFKFSSIAKQIVVVQKPEPRPKLLPLKGDLQSSSAAWANPAHRKTQADTDLAVAIPLPVTSDDELDDSFSEVQKLHETIAILKERLKRERKQRSLDELRIREEVCEEMTSQMVKIEMTYCERLREQEEQHEERLERKMELLRSIRQPSVDRMEDAEDEWVSSVLLHAEKTKVEIRDRRISELEAVIEQYKQRMASSELVPDPSESTPGTEQASSQTPSGEDTLAQQVAALKEELKEKEQEIRELNETLNEAGDTFMQKEKEIEKLQEASQGDEEKLRQQGETIRELRKLLEESQSALEVAQEKLTSRDIQILDLHTSSEELQERLAAMGEESKGKAEELAKKLQELQATVHERDVNISSLKEALETKAREAVELQEECRKQHELQNQIDSLKGTISEKEKLLEQTVMERDILKNQKEESVSLLESTGCQKDKTIAQLHDSISQRDVNIASLKEALETKTSEAVELQKECQKQHELQNQVDSLKGTISEKENLLEQTVMERDILKNQKEESVSLLESTGCQKDKTIAQLQDSLTQRDVDLQKQGALAVELKGKLEEVTSQLEELRGVVKDRDDRLENMQKLKEDMQSRKDENERLRIQITCKEEELESLKEDTNKLVSSLRDELIREKEQNKDLVQKIETQESGMKELRESLRQKDAGLQALTKVEEELAKEKADLQNLQKIVDSKEKEMESLKAVFDEHEKFADRIVQLEAALGSKEKQIIDLEKTISESGATMEEHQKDKEKICELQAALKEKVEMIEELENVRDSEKMDIAIIEDSTEEEDEEITFPKHDSDEGTTPKQDSNKVLSKLDSDEVSFPKVNADSVVTEHKLNQESDIVASPKHTAGQIDRLTKKISRLESEIATRKNKLREIEDAFGAKEREVTKLRTRLKREQEDFNQRELALIHGYTAEVENYKAQIVNLKVTCKPDAALEENAIQRSLESHKDAIEGNEKFKRDLLKQLRELQLQLDQKSSALVEAEQSLTIAKSAAEDLETRLAAELNGHSTAKILVDQLRKDLKNAHNSVQRESEQKGKEIEALQLEVAKSRGEMAIKAVEAESFKDKLEDMMNQREKKHTSGLESDQRSPDLLQEKIASCINDSVVEFRFHEVNFRIEELQQENLELKKQNNILVEKTKDSKCNKAEMGKAEIKRILEEKIQDLQCKNTAIQTELESKNAEFIELKGKLEEQEKRCRELTDDLEKYSDQVEELTVVKSSLTTMVDQVTEQLGDRDQKVLSLQMEVQALSKALEEGKASVVDLTEQLDKIKGQQETGKAEMGAKMSGYAQEVLSLQTAIEEGKAIIEDLTEKLVLCKNDKEAYDKERDEMQKTLANKDVLLAEIRAKLEDELVKMDRLEKEAEAKAECQKNRTEQLLGNISSLKTQVDEKQREAEYVQKSLSEKNSDIETLNDKISSLEADNEGLVAKLDMLKEMADSESVKRKEEEDKLQKCLQEKGKELQNLNTKITSLEEDVDELVNKLDTANDGVICKDEQIEKLQKEVACFVKEISKKEKLSEDLQDEVKSLRLEISEKNQSVGGKVAQLTETVNKKNTELEHLKEEVETLSKVIDTKSSEVDDLTKEAEIEKAELMKVIKDKTDLEREISEKNELVLQLETEKSVLERELSGKLSEWTSEQETLVKTLAEKEALLTEIKGRLEVEIAQVEGVEKASKMKEESQENKLSQLSAELNRLKSENADRNTEIKKLEQGLCERDMEVKALDSKVSGLEEEVRSLEKEKGGMVAAATGTAAEIEKLQKELSEKEKATELLNSKVSTLDLDVSELVEKLDAASSSIREKDENIQMLGKELEDLTKTVERKEKASQELTEEVKSLREEISEKNLSVGGKVAQLTETVDKKNKELEDLKEEVETLSKVIDTKSSEIDDLTKAIGVKTREIERLGQTLSEVQSEAEKNHKLVQELQGETTQLKADIQEKQCCIEQQQTEICELSSQAKQIDLLKTELVESRDKLGVASAELKNKINETMSLEKDMCDIKDKLCVSQESIDELKTTVEFLKAESEAKDNKIEDMNGEMEKLITEGVEKWEKIVQLEKELAESAEREETEHEEREKLADSSLSEGAKNVSQKLKEKEQEMEQLWICLSEKETDTDLLQEEIDNLKSKVDDFENQLAEKCRMLSSKQLTIGELQQKLSDMETKVLTESQAASAKEQKLQKQIENLRIELEEKCQAEQKLCAQVKELEKDLAGLRENIESKSTAKDGLCELEKELSECKQQLVSSENTAENLKVRILELEAEVSALAAMEDGGGHSVARNLRRQKIEAEKSKFEAECALNEALQEMESLRKKLAGHPNPAHHSVCEKPLLLPKKTVTLCLGKSSALLQNEECDEQENAKTESSTATTSEKLAKRLRDSTCHNELNKSQSREQALRGQLHQASETIREQNERLATLETQLQDKVTELEHAETRLKQLQDSARLQKTKQSDTIEEVETLRRDVKALQDELAKKEVRLATRNASVDQLMTQLEKDRNSYELAMKDAVANEKVMEDLRAAIELQEDTMAKQDTVITAREAEIAALKNELDELTQRYDELNEKDTSSRRQIAEISRSNSRLAEERESHNRRVDKQERLVAKLRQEKDELYVQLAEAKDEIKDLQKSNKDSNIEITLLETNVSEKATKLAETEACLKDATSNLASMAARLDEAETRLSQSQGGLSGKHADSAALSDLKKRLKEKEAAVRSLEKEVSRLQGEIFNIGAKKEEELQVWRDQRDQLVGSLEALMKKQSLEIKQLREERGDNSHKENIKELAKKLVARDEKIARLEEQVEILKQAHKVATASRGRRKFSQLAPDEQQELDVLRKQFEHEREEKILTQKQLSTVQRAKDQIISELKETNTQLQGQVTAIQSGTHHGRHRVASVTSDDLPPDEGTPTASKPKKRGRKRRSQEDIAPTEPEEGSKPATRSTRASKRKAMNRMEELKTNVQSSPKSACLLHAKRRKLPRALTSNPATVYTSPEVFPAEVTSGQRSSEVKVASKEARRKRKLYKVQMAEPFQRSPSSMVPAESSQVDAHEIVHRRLRERR